MGNDYQYENEMDPTHLWMKETPPVPVSGVSRLRRWLLPAMMAAAIVIIIIVLGVTSARTSNRLWSTEQRVSDAIQTLNASLLHAQGTADDVRRLQIAVQNNEGQLISVSEALTHLAELDSLSKKVAQLKCSLERIINNSSSLERCCPLEWTLFGFDCYFFSTVSLSWNESKNWCDQQSSHLVILHTDKEWDFVIQRTVSQYYWIGLSDWRTGKWEWVNQTPYKMERRRWEPLQPDNWNGHSRSLVTEDCAHLRNGHLNDNFCSTKMRFICQKQGLHT